MASLNKVILIGNVGKDPEVRHLETGTAVASFTLATTERYKNKNGEDKVRAYVGGLSKLSAAEREKLMEYAGYGNG